MSIGWNFDNTYRRLPEEFYSVLDPVPVKKPEWVLLNTRLAKTLGLHFSKAEPSLLAAIFTGNRLPEGAEPLAQAYAGHQFGHFTMLGDGRAIVIGEQITPDGKRYDLQLKGSGRTPYSRSGDGRATLYSMLREYLISEALYHLGVPASGSLAVAETGEPVSREIVHPGAVLTRVASSHIRIGTFEYASRFLSREKLCDFLNYTISRHYPDLNKTGNTALNFLKRVAEKHQSLVIEWMRTGFIHGVLNTDNMSIRGETIDFGPCAFMNVFHTSTAFSSVDTHRRYSFGNQPGIIQWNLSVLAETMLPFIDQDEEKAREAAEEVIESFKPRFMEAWYRMMGSKLGFKETGKQEKRLTDRILSWMESSGADYTNTFLVIAAPDHIPDHFETDEAFDHWHEEWKTLIQEKHGGMKEASKRMTAVNPLYIPRNHLVEDALRDASIHRDYTGFNRLLGQLKEPYQRKWSASDMQQVPAGFDQIYRTFCGT